MYWLEMQVESEFTLYEIECKIKNNEQEMDFIRSYMEKVEYVDTYRREERKLIELQKENEMYKRVLRRRKSLEGKKDTQTLEEQLEEKEITISKLRKKIKNLKRANKELRKDTMGSWDDAFTHQ